MFIDKEKPYFTIHHRLNIGSFSCVTIFFQLKDLTEYATASKNIVKSLTNFRKKNAFKGTSFMLNCIRMTGIYSLCIHSQKESPKVYQSNDDRWLWIYYRDDNIILPIRISNNGIPSKITPLENVSGFILALWNHCHCMTMKHDTNKIPITGTKY